MERYKIVKLLARAFAIEILHALNEAPLRFVDLKDYCPNERTRALRLKELRKIGFIMATVIEIENHSYIHYQITEKGRKVLQLLNELEKL
ncbi:hypothetical protein DRO54_02395 [Candidatus Bathyarchaeota archaeon]|nr:MAG: hypothetical protein DRO54_02395 [Candidatus Bathyarchaeota archaeon]